MTRLLILVGACALLWSLESIVPLYRYRDRRRLPNLGLAALVIAMNLALSFAAALVAPRSSAQHVLVSIVALDLFTWLAHVTLHQLPLAWRFHRVHHSDEEVDVTTTFRQHPGETVWRVLWQLPAIALFGVPFEVVALYQLLSALNAELEHANVRVPEPLDRMLRLLLVTPNMHKVHHSRVRQETDSNYGNLFSIWDRMFGTYTRRTDFATLRYGLDDVGERSLRGLLGLPFARSR